jgi:hypothetical protein
MDCEPSGIMASGMHRITQPSVRHPFKKRMDLFDDDHSGSWAIPSGSRTSHIPYQRELPANPGQVNRDTAHRAAFKGPRDGSGTLDATRILNGKPHHICTHVTIRHNEPTDPHARQHHQDGYGTGVTSRTPRNTSAPKPGMDRASVPHGGGHDMRLLSHHARWYRAFRRRAVSRVIRATRRFRATGPGEPAPARPGPWAEPNKPHDTCPPLCVLRRMSNGIFRTQNRMYVANAYHMCLRFRMSRRFLEHVRTCLMIIRNVTEMLRNDNGMITARCHMSTTVNRTKSNI